MTQDPTNPENPSEHPPRRLQIPNRIYLKRGIYLLPNLFTTAGMACGFYSIIQSIQGEFHSAAFLIIGAGIFDMIDGRVARLTKTTSTFGMQYDSLADLSSFGLAPALLLFRWGLEEFGRVGWIAAFLFFVCAALRLARFNTQALQSSKKIRYFTGLPVPLAAGMVATTIILHHFLGGEGTTRHLLVLLMAFMLAFLMVSTIKYRTFKDLNLRAQHSFQALVVFVAGALLILSNPETMLFICTSSYVASGLIMEAWRNYRKASKSLLQRNERQRDKRHL